MTFATFYNGQTGSKGKFMLNIKLPGLEHYNPGENKDESKEPESKGNDSEEEESNQLKASRASQKFNSLSMPD